MLYGCCVRQWWRYLAWSRLLGTVRRFFTVALSAPRERQEQIARAGQTSDGEMRIELVGILGWRKRICQSSAWNTLERFTMSGQNVFGMWWVLQKSFANLVGSGSFNKSVGVDNSGSQTAEPVDDERTRDEILSFRSNDAFARCRRTWVAEQTDSNQSDIRSRNGVAVR